MKSWVKTKAFPLATNLWASSSLSHETQGLFFFTATWKAPWDLSLIVHCSDEQDSQILVKLWHSTPQSPRRAELITLQEQRPSLDQFIHKPFSYSSSHTGLSLRNLYSGSTTTTLFLCQKSCSQWQDRSPWASFIPVPYLCQIPL